MEVHTVINEMCFLVRRCIICTKYQMQIIYSIFLSSFPFCEFTMLFRPKINAIESIYHYTIIQDRIIFNYRFTTKNETRFEFILIMRYFPIIICSNLFIIQNELYLFYVLIFFIFFTHI